MNAAATPPIAVAKKTSPYRRYWWAPVILVVALVMAFFGPIIFQPSLDAHGYWMGMRRGEGLLGLINDYCEFYEWNQTHRPGHGDLTLTGLQTSDRSFVLRIRSAAAQATPAHFMATEAEPLKLESGTICYAHDLWGGSFVEAKQAPLTQGPSSWGQIVRMALPASSWMALGKKRDAPSIEARQIRPVELPTWKTPELDTRAVEVPADVLASMQTIAEGLLSKIRLDRAFPLELSADIPRSESSDDWTVVYFPVFPEPKGEGVVQSAMLVCGPDTQPAFPPLLHVKPQKYVIAILRAEGGLGNFQLEAAHEVEWSEVVQAAKSLSR